MSTTGTKRCSKCKEDKLLSEFNACSRVPDGKQAWCRQCANAYKAGRPRNRLGIPRSEKSWRKRVRESNQEILGKLLCADESARLAAVNAVERKKMIACIVDGMRAEERRSDMARRKRRFAL